MLFIFDMGGVVTNTFDQSVIYKKLGITKEQFKDICSFEGKNIMDEFSRGNLTSKEFWACFNKAALEKNLLKSEVKYDLFRLYFNPIINPKTVELIQALKKKNRVVCGTNTIDTHYENHLERGDYSYFDKTYPSNRLGVIKPDPEFFKVILEAEGFKSEEAFFTDDKAANVEGAKSIGINAVLFSSAENLWKEWEKYI